MKKVLTLCMVALMLASVFAFTSCGLFGGVEDEVENLVNAESYTYEVYNDDGDITMLVKVDLENLSLYTETYNDKGKVTTVVYDYYDEDAGKYYHVICDKDGDPETKIKIDEDAFYAAARGYAVAGAEMYQYTKLSVFMSEDDDELSYSANDSNKTITIYIDEDDKLCYEVKTGKTVVTDIRYYDIDDTEIEIPEEVIEKKVSKS